MAGKCCFSTEFGTGYFFNRDKYMVLENIIPGQSTEAKVHTPLTPISHAWPSLKAAGFTSIDAAVHIGAGEVYLFSGSRFIQVSHIVPDANSDKLKFGPAEIADHWQPLKDQRFDFVDAVLSMGAGEAYFFHLNQYLRIGGINRDKPGGKLEVETKDIRTYWKSFQKAKVGSIEAALSVGDTRAFVFAGPLCFFVKDIVVDELGETITEPTNTAESWPALEGLWW